MSGSQNWFVYDADRELRARLVYCEDAAVLISFIGQGSYITHQGRIVWREGEEDQEAAESYDHVRQVCWKRAGIGQEEVKG